MSLSGVFGAESARAKENQTLVRQCRRPPSSTLEGDHRQGWAAADFVSCASIADASTKVRPMWSRPSIRHCLRKASISNLTTPPSGPRISCAGKSIGQRRVGAALGVVHEFGDGPRAKP